MTLHYEVGGEGPAVVLLHEGICDSRMWDPQWDALTARYCAVRLDFPGFGQSELRPGRQCLAEDVMSTLDLLEIGEAAFVAASLGGRVALELAVGRPERVSALMLVGSGILGHEWSEPVQVYAAEEERALERSDLDGAVETNLRMWVDGPHRSPSDVDPAVRAAVGEMQRVALEAWLRGGDDVDEEALVPDIAARLAEIRAPALVLVGELDVDDIHVIASRLRSEIPDARYGVIPGTAHVPNMERPDEFNKLLLGFLAETV